MSGNSSTYISFLKEMLLTRLRLKSGTLDKPHLVGKQKRRRLLAKSLATGGKS
jgi:hypothetical protein